MKTELDGPFNVFVNVSDPCDTLIELSKESLRQGTSEESQGAIQQYTLMSKVCKQTFNTKVLSAIHDLDGCMLKPKKAKRSLVALIPDIVQALVGVTNFIKGISQGSNQSRRDLIPPLNNKLKESTHDFLLDKRLMIMENEKELSIVSSASTGHLDQIREITPEMPFALWSSYHVLHELFAGVANLKTIKSYCEKGQLATTELAEMLENSALAKLKPSETQLESITLQSPREIEIVYKTFKAYEINDESIVIAIMFSSLVILLVILVASSCKIAKLSQKSSLNSNVHTIERIIHQRDHEAFM